MPRSALKRFFRLLGKSDRKIVAVFATSARYEEAVDYVRAGTGGLPIWLLAAGPVDAAVARKCERVFEVPSDARLLARAAKALWPNWVALNVVVLTRERGFFWLKLAPLFVPPWKLLVMNEHGDFFSGWPAGLLVHGARRTRDRCFTWAESVKDLALGVFWKVAWTILDPVLERTSAPWRRLPTPPPLEADPASPRKAGVLLWAPIPAADRRALEAAVQRLGLPYEITSSAAPPFTNYKYILAAEEPPAGELDGLLRLLERPDTFAARLQPGRAGFQKDVLPRAAFRQLQPGEASAVLAPAPGVVLLDAAKLAQLGGWPPAASRRCRWLLLFWRAAAAGWKSYDVGAAPARLNMIADRAFPEAEFCFRLWRQRPPAEPPGASLDARRGSISFQPRHEPALRSGARRILIVSPYMPFPLSHGGAVRIFNLARELSGRYELLLIAFREPEDAVDYERLASCFARVIVVDHAERRARDPDVPEAVAQFRSRAMRAAIQEAAAACRPDLLQIEYTQLAAYRDALPHVPAVLVEHDVTFSLHEQLSSSEFDRWYRYESHWLKQYDAVAVMSEEEKSQAARAGAAADRLWVVPNGVDTERFRPAAGPEGPPELLYVGSFRHLPNILGFEHLRHKVLPRLWERFPNLRARVVAGPEHEKHWRQFAAGKTGQLDADARIAVEGFVEDLAPYYARAQVVVVPLVVSAGTNIKVLEALACGKPVVSTPIGCAGLGLAEEKEILVAAEAADFQAAVTRLLEEPALRQRLGEQARRAAVERYSWKQSAERAAAMYEALWRRSPADQINSCQVIRSAPL